MTLLLAEINISRAQYIFQDSQPSQAVILSEDYTNLEISHLRWQFAGVGAAGKGASVRSKAGWTKKAAGTGYSSATGIAETVTKVAQLAFSSLFVMGMDSGQKEMRLHYIHYMNFIASMCSAITTGELFAGTAHCCIRGRRYYSQ